jgi:hypothetical protein
VSEDELVPYDPGPDCQPSGEPFRNLIPRNPARAEEAVYAEWARGRMREIADQISEALPDGMRFEFPAGDE